MDIEFALSDEEIEHVSSLLEDQYCPEAILWIHQGMLIAPRLISIEVLPGPEVVSLLDPDFRINSVHVATSMRILGLSKYGALYFMLLKKYELKDFQDVNLIVTAMQYAYEKLEKPSAGLWVSTMVDLQKSLSYVFKEEPVFSKDIGTEIDFCDEVLKKAFNVNDLSTQRKAEEGIQGFLKKLGEIMEEDDTTDEDDVAL
jgi:hypothetical protein